MLARKGLLGIASEYDMVVLFSLVFTYKVLNLNDVGDKGHNTFTSQGTQSTNLYDSLGIVEDMALSAGNKHLTHFKIKKVTIEECKDHLGWWKTHEVQFFYIEFIAQQIFEIVGSQIKAK
jgi:hypothetical protein